MKFKMTIWNILSFTGLGSHEIIDDFIRPNYGTGQGLFQFILGVSPNLLAAALIFPFTMLTIRDAFTNENQKQDETNLNYWFWITLIVSQIGLIIWEYMQKEGNLAFDRNDIIATLIGGGFAILAFLSFKKKYLLNLNKKEDSTQQ